MKLVYVDIEPYYLIYQSFIASKMHPQGYNGVAVDFVAVAGDNDGHHGAGLMHQKMRKALISS